LRGAKVTERRPRGTTLTLQPMISDGFNTTTLTSTIRLH
jgi:hypothetical protein